VEISVGHTPDSDDAFMFYGMFTDKVTSPDFQVNHVIEDIEKLNKKATNPELDVTAVSVHACAYTRIYNSEKWRKLWNWIWPNSHIHKTDDNR
jgi:1,4-dihydroxy-6-naphthoate synthase